MDNYKPSRPGMVQPEKEKRVFTADMLKGMGNQAPMEPDSGSAPSSKRPAEPKRPIVKKAHGGKIDGCAQRGKTRGKVV